MDQQTTVLVETLKAQMDREGELFLAMSREMERLRDSVVQKKWTTGLAIAQDLERFARGIEDADCERDRTYTALCAGFGLAPESLFFSLLPRVDTAQRGPLEDSWRNLRTSLVRLATATNRMRYFAEALAGTLGSILEGVFPHRRGKIYSRRGKATSVNDALLVDRKL